MKLSGPGVSFMGRFLIIDLISSTDMYGTIQLSQSNCGFIEGSFFFLWPLSGLTSWFFFLLHIYVFKPLYVSSLRFIVPLKPTA